MVNETPPPQEVVHAGYESRDFSIPLVVLAAILLVLGGIVLFIALWQVSVIAVPEQKERGAAPPMVMPGEPPVNDRLRAVPPPGLENATPPQRPEDLRADRQPLLNSPAWIEKGKVGRIPISTAMNAVVEAERAKAAKKGGGK